MGDEDEWTSILQGHPIFTPLGSEEQHRQDASRALVLSTDTLTKFIATEPTEDERVPAGRRQVMVLKDADLIVAVGKEIRICSLGDARHNRDAKKTYKTLHAPNIQFEIHHLALNPNGKLLAVVGACQVAVVVLPRPGFTRLVPSTIDCKSIQIGQFYHASDDSAPLAKVEWHPWGEGGSALMVMTTDGKFREYDISIDNEEPQQVLSFIPERKSGHFMAEDASEREIASFTLGKGKADWGPLTVYAVTKSGDVYAICPYMPKNAHIPSSYVHALECFIAAKQEFLCQEEDFTFAAPSHLTTIYDYQRKYVNALIKQLPPATIFPALSRPVLMHPPTTVNKPPKRQGPFLLQPSPQILEGSEGADATDITYLAFGSVDDLYNDNDSIEDEGETERLGLVLVAFRDGKVDVCIDVEKVEARWESRNDRDLPMLAMYETIDLGLVSMLSRISSSLLDLLQGNHPLFLVDPIHEDVVHIYHAFGVHSVHLGPMLRSITAALRAGDEEGDEGDRLLTTTLEKAAGTVVRSVLNTFSFERKCSSPVIGVAIPNDIYLAYSIFILTSAMRITSFPLAPRVETVLINGSPTPDPEKHRFLIPLEGPPAYVSLLSKEPYTPPAVLSQPIGLPSNPRMSTSAPGEFMLTPETMRYLGSIVESFSHQIHAVQLAYRNSEVRVELQRQEFKRQQEKAHELVDIVGKLKSRRSGLTQYKLNAVLQKQKELMKRLDRVLQALMRNASPGPSEHEKKWFEELQRMHAEVLGLTKYEEGSLAARTSLLRREYARILPSLKELLEEEKERKKRSSDTSQGLGVSQAFHLGEISNHEHAKITRMEEEVTMLATKLDLNLEHRPGKGND